MMLGKLYFSVVDRMVTIVDGDVLPDEHPRAVAYRNRKPEQAQPRRGKEHQQQQQQQQVRDAGNEKVIQLPGALQRLADTVGLGQTFLTGSVKS